MTLAHCSEPSQRPVLDIQHISMLGKAIVEMMSSPLCTCHTMLLGNPEVCGKAWLLPSGCAGHRSGPHCTLRRMRAGSLGRSVSLCRGHVYRREQAGRAIRILTETRDAGLAPAFPDRPQGKGTDYTLCQDAGCHISTYGDLPTSFCTFGTFKFCTV